MTMPKINTLILLAMTAMFVRCSAESIIPPEGYIYQDGEGPGYAEWSDTVTRYHREQIGRVDRKLSAHDVLLSGLDLTLGTHSSLISDLYDTLLQQSEDSRNHTQMVIAMLMSETERFADNFETVFQAVEYLQDMVMSMQQSQVMLEGEVDPHTVHTVQREAWPEDGQDYIQYLQYIVHEIMGAPGESGNDQSGSEFDDEEASGNGTEGSGFGDYDSSDHSENVTTPPFTYQLLETIETLAVRVQEVSTELKSQNEVLQGLMDARNGPGADKPHICHGQFYDMEGLMQTPNYPEDYPNNFRSVASIIVPESMTVRLVFELFYLEHTAGCKYDYLELFDGSTDPQNSVGKYCGDQTGTVVNATTSQLNMKFVTDGSVNTGGFLMFWHAI